MLSQIKQTKYNILLKEKMLPFFVPLIVSVAIWWNPNFLVPDTYYNIGDTVFSLAPSHYLKKISSSWISDEIGFSNLIPTIIPPYFIIFLLDYFSIPLWLINRLWLVIPTAMVGWSTYYLFRSVLNGRYAMVSGVIASIFSMLPPQISVIPLWYISLSGFALILGALIRGLNSSKVSWKYPILISFGVVFLLGNPRCFYLAMIAVFIYLVIYFYLDRSLLKTKIAFLSIACVVTLIANAFWLIPTIYYYISGNPSLEANLSGAAKAGGAQWDILRAYVNWSDPLWIIRLMTSGPLSTKDYIIQPFIYPFTFIMPFYAFASLFLVKNNKSFTSFKIITPLFLVFAFSLHFSATAKVYFYLFEHFPGFIILNSPNYWLFVLGVMYAILTGAATQVILSKIDGSEISFRLKNVFIMLLISSQIVLITVVYGGGVLIGCPQNSTGSDNHISATKTPKEYFELNNYLLQNAVDGNRLLNLPLVNDPYCRYTWFYIKPMPEIVASISPIPVLGLPQSPTPVKSVIISLKEENSSGTYRMLKSLGIQFILLHKDYYKEAVGFNPNDVHLYERHFAKSAYFKKVMDNKYFDLYKLIEESMPAVYLIPKAASNSAIVDNDAAGSEPSEHLLKLSGKNFIDLGNPQLLNFKEEFTISLWVYMSHDSVSPQGIFMKNAGTGDSSDNYGIMVSHNKVWFPLNFGKTTMAFNAGSVDRNNWYHLIVTLDKGNSEYILYINGMPVSIVQVRGGIIPSQSPVLIGSYGGFNPTHYFKGFITNVQVYGESLTYKEVQQLYFAGIQGKALKNLDLRGWWKLDKENVQGTIVRDLSGHSIHGVVKGEGCVYDSVPMPAISTGNGDDNMKTVSYIKESDTEYRLTQVEENDFYLVLNQAFHPLWKAFVGEREVAKHSPSEIGMNKWFVKNEKGKEIRIVFAPQKWFNIGLLISSIYCGIIIAVAVVLSLSRRLKSVSETL